jgi:hypothetical protein
VATEVAYCRLDEVKTALDVPETSRSDAQILREILASSRSIEGDLKRYFYPLTAVASFDYPDHQFSVPWRLWLDEFELTTLTQVLAAGTDITSSVLARPDNAALHGEPYDHLEINLSTSAMFVSGSTYQRAITVGGVFGYTAAETSGGSLAAAVTDTTSTAATVSDSTLVGVGSIIRVDTERLNVTGRGMAATGQTITNSPAAANNQNTVSVQDGTQIHPGETIQVDAEQMYVQAVTGNNLTVLRAWNGTTVAAHTVGAVVYAPRLLTVERASLGTTAATHASAAPVFVHQVPSLIRDWCVAETVATLTQVRRGYGTVIKRSTGSSASPSDPVDLSSALPDLRDRARARYTRFRTLTAARLI